MSEHVARVDFLNGEWEVTDHEVTIYGRPWIELEQHTDVMHRRVYVPTEAATISKRLPPEPDVGTAVWVRQPDGTEALYYRLPDDILRSSGHWVHYAGPVDDAGQVATVRTTHWDHIGRDARPITTPLEDMVSAAGEARE